MPTTGTIRGLLIARVSIEFNPENFPSHATPEEIEQGLREGLADANGILQDLLEFGTVESEFFTDSKLVETDENGEQEQEEPDLVDEEDNEETDGEAFTRRMNEAIDDPMG